ncbi:MAG: restriction endonuclease subunit S, partial [Tissierellia bacterium]|nr:restriction endonuclease subunit S [Tissierellia bacterium]
DGTTIKNVSLKTMREYSFMIPENIDEQKRIADVLSALDDKIEVNNKINENLEAQAQAIFKQWFVDFEFPDSEGKPYKTNGGKFIDSELGEIPEGWKVGKIRDIVLSTIGGDWGKEQKIDNYISEVYCIRGADINDIIKGNKGKMPTRFILEKNYNSKKLEANDIVIEISGGSPTQSTGRVALITDALLNRYDKSMICTNFCRAIKPLENYSYFIFYYWRYLYDLNTMFSYENGTTGIKNLDINGVLDNENVVLPNIELLNCFNNYVLNIMKTIFNNGLESENLSEIRDSLLPKLMSGEIRV